MSKIFSLQLVEQFKKLDTAGQVALLISGLSIFGTGYWAGTYMSAQSVKIEVEKKNLEMSRLQLATEKLQSEAASKAELATTNLEVAQGVIRDLQASEASLRASLKEREDQLFDTRMAALLPVGSPYPAGLDDVKIGDHISQVDAAYQSENLDKRKRRVIVDNADPIIQWVLYDHSREEEDGIIYKITFDTRKLFRELDNLPDLPSDLFTKALTRALGEAGVSGRDKECSWWFVSDQDDADMVFHVGSSGKYSIQINDIAPTQCFPFYDRDGERIELD